MPPSVLPKRAQPPDPDLGRALAEADDFVAVAHRVCTEAARQLELNVCAVALHRASGGPEVLADTLPLIDDAYRLATVCPQEFAGNPLYAEDIDPEAVAAFARRHWLSVELGHVVVAPLINSSGVVGSIQCGRAYPYDAAARREIATMATQVSVRLAQLGITAIGGDPPRARLTPRQYEIAALVVDGATNCGVSAVLEISPNTVKKLLKQIFLRLGVHSRTELASMFRRVVAPIDIPRGVTRLRTITITRAP
jgi:DNA-binding CsgD family transcriptional regulator